MKIAIVKLSALGDIVHAMVVLQFIKKFNKEISIDWIVEEEYKDLLEFHKDIRKVHLVNLKRAKERKSFFLLLSELKKVRKFGFYDLVIDMQGLIKSALISKIIRAPITIGFDKLSVRETTASLFYNKTFNYDYEKNVIERNIALISFALGFSVTKKQIQNKIPFLHLSNKQLEIKLSNSKKNILLIPGSSQISKCYPSYKLAEVASSLDANFFVIWGNDIEKIMASHIKKLSHNVTICNKLQLHSLVLLISMVDLVIGPDTGPTHISWAMNIPSITLFGPTPGYRNTYETIINRIIESDSKVDPNNLDKTDYSIDQIKVQKIVEVAKELLAINKSDK
jgi:heptosyltransferase I